MKQKTVYVCDSCGNETSKWFGRCTACGSWNTLKEMTVSAPTAQIRGNVRMSTSPMTLNEISIDKETRFLTGMGELDRVLGGGAVSGSFILVGGEPGIGKSTLLLQICTSLCQNARVLYVSGEESLKQIKLRAQRLKIDAQNLYIHSETCLETIYSACETLSPQIMIIDSIQTMYCSDVQSAPGNATQIKECAMSLLQFAKNHNITIFIVGHVTKEGSLAGPKMLEHMVDCVLYFEGERHISYRIIRAAKNRFGSTNEIGLFEMTSMGLKEVPNPSEALLSGRPKNVPGSCISCIMEGSRPMLAEIQALVSKSQFGTPRRTSNGFDYNRAVLLMAVIEKRAGIFIGAADTYINVTGGLRIDEPSADLSAVLAIVSSARDITIRQNLVALGEVGLTGELRDVSNASQRLAEISRLGFNECILPYGNKNGTEIPEGMTVHFVNNIREAIAIALTEK